MIALLGMYDRPEIAGANDQLWSLIRDQLGYGPKQLTRDCDFWEVWQSPDLLLAQTCGLPYRHSLHSKVQLVGTPDYGIAGCEPGFYRSVIVARAGSETRLDELPKLRLAFNERLSQSGWAAFWAHVPEGSDVKQLVQTGAHIASAKAVAEGHADIASLDVVTWNLIQTFDGFADQLTVIAETSPAPGLPFITALSRDVQAICAAVEAAIQDLDQNSRDLLQITGFVQISKQAYLTIPLPPA